MLLRPHRAGEIGWLTHRRPRAVKAMREGVPRSRPLTAQPHPHVQRRLTRPGLDFSFCALPQEGGGADAEGSKEQLLAHRRRRKVVDRSADFLLADPVLRQMVAATSTTRPDCQKEAVITPGRKSTGAEIKKGS